MCPGLFFFRPRVISDMRLLNATITTKLVIKEFLTDIPPYAILSHTWGDGEVTFQDVQHDPTTLPGFLKVRGACEHARNYNFEWIWIDTCCIDKTSSAELSEAINSMYRYYEASEVCYVYLPDVSSTDDLTEFGRSRWFTRGWTLQELLAPSHVVFLNQNWVEIGTRWSLSATIFSITSIPIDVFEEGYSPGRFSIAQRMSWAASRETTRPEDAAYCLMGIFGVSMPPIYGEGSERAFMRLQQEIIKISDDRSIFAWTAPQEEKRFSRGMLARSPSEFKGSGSISKSEPRVGHKSSFSFNNNALYMHLPLLDSHLDSHLDIPNVYLASLDCRMRERDTEFVGIYLQNTGEEYVRYYAGLFTFIPAKSLLSDMLREVVVKENRDNPLTNVTPFEHIQLHPRLSVSARKHLEHHEHYRDPFAYSSTQDRYSRSLSDRSLFANYWHNRRTLPQNCDEWRLMSSILQWMLTDRFMDRIQIHCDHHGLFLVEFQRTGIRSVRVLEVDFISRDDPTSNGSKGRAGNQWNDLHNVLFDHSAFQIFWESRISSKSKSLFEYITFEATELAANQSRLIPVGTNLITAGMMAIKVSDNKTLYGYKISSTYWNPLYVWLFSYNLSDLSIRVIYEPTEGEPCLRPEHVSLDIGYGMSRADPQSFYIPQGIPADVSYFKLFVSISFFDLSDLQSSPFIELSTRQMSKAKAPTLGGLLGTLIIPVIQEPHTI
ncbi:hypothetical protein VKT23_003433 [Stygiomarasmius scandens]|uniref:Heterokaryon incompatibility domain-containing protein n=1 Tax=Marasmiellus scandens TaxID=2682957 RepID=A0ABR1JYW4_9AGAR